MLKTPLLKFNKLLVLCFVFLSFNLEAQWINSGGGYASTKTTDISFNNNNLFWAGDFLCNVFFETINTTYKLVNNTCESGSPLNSSDLFITKLNKHGSYDWIKQTNIAEEDRYYVKSGGFDSDNNNNSYLSGNYFGEIEFSGTTISSISHPNIFITKYNSIGDVEWVLDDFSSIIKSDSIEINDLKTDNLNHSIIVGSFRDTTHYDSLSGFVISVNDDKSIYSSLITIPINNNSLYDINSINSSNSNLIISGIIRDSIQIGNDTIHSIVNGNKNAFIAGLNLDLSLNWLIQEDIPFFNSVTIDNSSIYTTGSFENTIDISGNNYTATPGAINSILVKYDLSGNYLWSKIIREQNNFVAKSTCLDIDNIGNIYLGGYFGQKDQETHTPVLTIGATNTSGISAYDGFISKFDAAGNLIWSQALGDTLNDYLYAINAISTDTIFVGGSFYRQIVIDDKVVENVGAQDAYIALIDVHPEFKIEITANSNTEFCEGNNVTLQATTSATYSYQWQKDSVNISGANSSSFSASETGSYRVVITDSSIPYTKKTLPIDVIVNPVPNPIISTVDDTVFCNGEYAQLNIDYTTNSKYQWYINNNPIPDDTLNYSIADSTGIYHVTELNKYNCFNTSPTISIFEKEYPTVEILPNDTLKFCYGDSVTLNSITSEPLQFLWIKDEIELINDTLDSFTAYESGYYALQVTDSIGCISISETDTVVTIPSPISHIEFGGDSIVCEGEQVGLFANTGLGLTYEWYRNDTLIPGASSYYYLANISGDYYVNVSNENNCTIKSNTKNALVYPIPESAISISGPNTFCSNDNIYLSTISVPTNDYQWFLNGQEINGETNDTYYPITSGEYYLNTTSQYGCSKSSNKEYVIVIPAPEAIIESGGDSVFCEGTFLTINANKNSNYHYTWYKDNIEIIGENSFNLDSYETGTYRVLIEDNTTNCSSLSNNLNLYSEPSPEVILSVSNSTICQRDSVELTSTLNANWKYKWYYNEILLPDDTSNNLYAKTAGNYSVVVLSEINCTDTSNIQSISVLPNPLPTVTQSDYFLSTKNYSSIQWNNYGLPISDATEQIYLVTESGDYSVTVLNPNGCYATSEELTVCYPIPEIYAESNKLTSSEGLSYQWYVDNNLITGAEQQVHYAQLSGEYIVEVTDYEDCVSQSDPYHICVPVPTIQLVENNILESSSGKTYQWYLNDEPINDAKSKIYLVTETGYYTVEVLNFEDCLYRSEPFYMVISDLGASVNESTFSISPNPVTKNLNIKCISNHTGSIIINITDISGNQVLKNLRQKENLNFSEIIDVSELNQGLYILNVIINDEILRTKFIKQ